MRHTRNPSQGLFRLVPPARIELALTVPETDALSTELRGPSEKLRVSVFVSFWSWFGCDLARSLHMARQGVIFNDVKCDEWLLGPGG